MAGYNTSKRCRLVRHLEINDLCPLCGESQDETHMVNSCNKYNEERNELRIKLLLAGINRVENLDITELTLYGDSFQHK